MSISPNTSERPSRRTRAVTVSSPSATGRMKLVLRLTVVIGRKPPSALEIAMTMAVSAADMKTWPQITPPTWRKASLAGSRRTASVSDTATGVIASCLIHGAKISSIIAVA